MAKLLQAVVAYGLKIDLIDAADPDAYGITHQAYQSPGRHCEKCTAK